MPKRDAFDRWDETFPFGPLDIRDENAEDKARKERKGTRPMPVDLQYPSPVEPAEQTRYEELLQKFVEDERNKQLLGSLEGLYKDAKRTERKYGLANALLALSGSEKRLDVPERELPPEEELTEKEELQLGVIKQGLVDLAKLQQEMRGVDDPSLLLKRRGALFTTLTGAAANIMSTTATSVAHRDRAKISAAGMQYDSALRALGDFEVLSERISGDTDPTVLNEQGALALVAEKNFSPGIIAAALRRVPEADREAVKVALKQARRKLALKRAGGLKAPAKAQNKAKGETNAIFATVDLILAGEATGQITTPSDTLNRIDDEKFDSILRSQPNTVTVTVMADNGVVNNFTPDSLTEYKGILRANEGKAIVTRLTDEAAKSFAEDFVDPQAMLDSQNSFLGELVDSVRAVGGETFGKDLDKLMTDLSGLPEDTETWKKLDAILGMEALSADAAQRLGEIEGKQEELIGKAPETKRRYTPEMMKDELASRAIDFFNQEGGDLSSVPDPTRFLRHSFKARKQVLRGHDVNLPLASGKKFEGKLPTEDDATAALVNRAIAEERKKKEEEAVTDE